MIRSILPVRTPDGFAVQVIWDHGYSEYYPLTRYARMVWMEQMAVSLREDEIDKRGSSR